MGQSQKWIEFWVGFFVILSLGAGAYLGLKVARDEISEPTETYLVSGLFGNIGGLKEGAKVTVSGVNIGRVTKIELDPITFRARVYMAIYKNFNDLPIDSSASIMTAGILGDQYVGIDPGGDDQVLQNGDVISITQSALVLEELVNKLVTKFTQQGG